MRLEVLNLYYSLTSSEEHRRILDGQLYANASAFLTLYEKVLDTDFPAFKQSFPPDTSGQIGFVGYVDFSRNIISMHGFRPLNTADTKVLLLPVVHMPGLWQRDNKGYLAGSLRMHTTDSSQGFQNISIADEVFLKNICPSLEKIIKQGKLDERQNKDLLIERVFAICVTHCQDFFQKYHQDASSSYLPLRLKELKEYVLYKIAYVLLDFQHTEKKMASDQSQEQWTGGSIRSVSIVVSAQEQAEIEEQAWMVAKRGENMAHGREELLINTCDFLSLLEDIDNLGRLNVVEIEHSPLITWYDKHRTGVIRLQGPELFAEINQLLEDLYLSFLNEYQILVTRNFPTLCHEFTFYNSLPAKFSVALDTAHYDPNPQINPLAEIGILVQNNRENAVERNSVILVTSEEIYSQKSHSSIDSSQRRLSWSSSTARFVLSPCHSYTSFEVRNSLCILRSLVYRCIENDLKKVLTALVARYSPNIPCQT
jgi:hypothetical protein